LDLWGRKWWEAAYCRASLLVCFARYYYGDHIKEGNMGQTCTMHGRDEKFIQNFGWETEGKRQLRRPKHRCEDNIKMDLTEIG